MQFGLFYEMQLPRPWEPGDEHRLYRECLEQVVLADQLGFDYVWEVEHHFLEEYSHSSAPEVFLAAAAARHAADPPRPRHRAVAAGVQPHRPGRRAGGHARPAVRRPGGPRHRRGLLGGRAGRLRRGVGHQARPVDRPHRGRGPHDGRGAVRRLGRQVAADAPAQRGSQAAAEAAPAAVGGLQPPRDHPAGRAVRDRGVVVPVHRTRAGGELGGGVRVHPGLGGLRAGRLRGEPADRHRPSADVPSRRADRRRPGARLGALLRLRAAALLRLRHPPPGSYRRVAGLRDQPGGGRVPARRGGTHRRAARRHLRRPGGAGAAGRHRDARSGALAAAPLRGGRHRPGHLHGPDGAHPPHPDLRVTRTHGRRGDRRVRRAAPRALGAQVRAPRPRHRGRPGPQGRRPAPPTRATSSRPPARPEHEDRRLQARGRASRWVVPPRKVRARRSDLSRRPPSRPPSPPSPSRLRPRRVPAAACGRPSRRRRPP